MQNGFIINNAEVILGAEQTFLYHKHFFITNTSSYTDASQINLLKKIDAP